MTSRIEGADVNSITSRSIPMPAGVTPLLGRREIAIKNIINLLAQANFVQKIDDTTIHLTQRGCDFVIDFLDPLSK